MIADILLPAALACIMFSVGLSLRPADFRRVFAQPRGLVLGLFGQLVGVPAAAFAIVSVGDLPATAAVGLMILAACPGGASSAFLTRLARGNAALSLTLTVLSSLAALFTFPLFVSLVCVHVGAGGMQDGLARFADVSIASLIGSVLVVTTLPVLAGMQLRRRAPALAERSDPLVRRAATMLFIAIVLGTFIVHRQTIVAGASSVGPASILLNLLVIGAAYAVSAVFGSPRGDAVAVAMECGLQNAGLAIYVAVVLMREPQLAVPAVVYALTMNAGALALVALSRVRAGRGGPALQET